MARAERKDAGLTLQWGWLSDVCGDPEERPWISRPLKCFVDSKPVTVATDGRRMVVVDGHLKGAKKLPTNWVIQPAVFAKTAAFAVRGKRIPLGDFRTWVMRSAKRSFRRWAWIGGLLFDLSLLETIVRNVRDEQIRLEVHERSGQLRLAGDGWRACLMMVLPGAEADMCPKWETT